MNTVAVMAMLVVTDDMEEEMAYNITKAIYDNIDYLKDAHKAGEMITKEGHLEYAIDLHPGAAKYFEEEGIILTDSSI